MPSIIHAARRPSRAVLTFFIVAVLGLSFSSGWQLGRQQGVRAAVPEGEGRVINQGASDAALSDDVDFAQFWNVWNLVKENYYQQPVSDKNLFYGAMKGMVASSGDRYTVYFDPAEAESFQSALNGTFSGIGAELGVKDDQLTVVAPLSGSPAETAGLRAGDIIVSIDGLETAGMSVEWAVSKIRGEEGTQVTLTIFREGATDTEDIPITRSVITVDSVKWNIDDNGMAFVSISEFNQDTSPLFNQAVNEILSSGAKGIVLDLRSDPGGLLTAAIDVASAWVGYQPVVLQKQQEDVRSYPGVSAPRLADIPTVVLVDGGSASASEIVSGALQDYGLATLVGTQTFGKGSVQDYRQLPDGSAVKITIAQWFTPDGRTINETGITPDVIVEYTQQDAHDKRDPQKEKALEILAEKQVAAH